LPEKNVSGQCSPPEKNVCVYAPSVTERVEGMLGVQGYDKGNAQVCGRLILTGV